MSHFRSDAPTWIKRLVWNAKHAGARLAAPADIVSRLLERRVTSVLDMGCGTGDLYRSLRDRGWTGSYTGVDISDAAILRARRIGPEAEWIAAPLECFRPNRSYDAICFIESIYYTRLRVLPEIMANCTSALNPHGTIFVRIWDREEHADYVRFLASQSLALEIFP